MQLAAIISILLELRSRLRSPGIDAGYLSVNCCRNVSTVNFLPKNCCQIARLLNDSKTWRSPKTIGRRPLCFSEEPRLRETREKNAQIQKAQGGKGTRVLFPPNLCVPQQKISTLRGNSVLSLAKVRPKNITGRSRKREKQRLSNRTIRDRCAMKLGGSRNEEVVEMKRL